MMFAGEKGVHSYGKSSAGFRCRKMGGTRGLLLGFHLAVIFFFTVSVSRSLADTDPLDATSLRVLYLALNSPENLKGWMSDGGDPCGESWTGVSCSGSSVIYIDLHGLELTGYLGGDLHNLHHLKQLDVSSNNIQGEIPYGLPPNVTHLNLACNKFSQNIPHSISLLEKLRHLNLSHNSLFGPIGDVFRGLESLREMDLSYNSFSGDLPSSFASLTNLSRLFLQNNTFTGSVIFLADLPLSDLNIQNNDFSGVIPEQFHLITNLWMKGNKFHLGEDFKPWNSPSENMPYERNISSPPTRESSAIENHPSLRTPGYKKKKLGSRGIATMAGGATLLVSCVAFVVAFGINRSRARKQNLSEDRGQNSLHSLPISSGRGSSAAFDDSPMVTLTPPPVRTPNYLLPTRRIKNDRTTRKNFSRKIKTPANVKFYTVAELQLATNSFSEENFVGEGSLGSVYRADFPDGQVMAVKNINTVALSLHEEEQFLDVIWSAARLRHPNIVRLMGYCLEHGQHLLVYEYVRNLSLDEVLHSEVPSPLPWSIRLKIALGVARALEYLHSAFSPAVTHSNLTASNILLDEELTPRICDVGLAALRPLTSNSIKVKASEMAIGNAGYIAPEYYTSGTYTTKSDIYAFGVLLLELLTGRRPLDREQLSLAKWASTQLHDGESLEQMVDPSTKRTLTSQALSRYADIVSLCIQPEKEFRPPMSEIVESLNLLIPKPGTIAAELDPFTKSFRSTQSGFMVSSPTMSYSSM